MPSRYRIVHVMASTDGVMGGVEKHTLALCAALAQKHEVHLIANNQYRQYCDKQVQFHALRFGHGLFACYSFWQLVRYINTIQPNIVHSQAYQATQRLKYLQWFFKHIKFVATAHNLHHVDVYKRSDGLIVLNENLLNSVESHQVRLIYQGIVVPPKASLRQIDTLRYQLGLNKEKPILVTIGELNSNHGCDVLLKAMVDIDAQLLIIGDGVKKQALHDLAHTLAINHKVFFVGERDDADIFLQLADLCVVPDLETDSSLTVIRALQASCPVVATNIIGFKEWLSPALLAPPNDVSALHETLCATIRALATLKANYLPIFLRAQQELTMDYMVQQTERFYFDLLECT